LGSGGSSTSSGSSAGPDSGVADGGGAVDATTIHDAAAVDANAGEMISVELSLYGWPDNTPPSDQIAFPQIHQVAGGIGTYDDPVTFATDSGEEPPGTIIYIPAYLKYAIMEDACADCSNAWSSNMTYWFKFWLASNGRSDPQAVFQCERAWARSMTTVEVNPPPGRTVDTTPLFDPQTNTCSTKP
jgi:hypothetical protein